MPLDDPKFLSRKQVDRWHRFSLEQYGGKDGLRSEDSLESALGAPINNISMARQVFLRSLPHTLFTSPKLKLT